MKWIFADRAKNPLSHKSKSQHMVSDCRLKGVYASKKVQHSPCLGPLHLVTGTFELGALVDLEVFDLAILILLFGAKPSAGGHVCRVVV